MQTLIEVTADDIACGVPRSGPECPIARALNRATGKKWSVGPNGGRCYGVAPWEWVSLPHEAREFMKAFDSWIAIKFGAPAASADPFSFMLDIPE